MAAGDRIPTYDPATTVRSETVTIEAPASLVWEVLTDLPRYGEWNPFCFAAESSLEVGAPVRMQLNSYTMPGETYANVEYVCAKMPERLLAWELPDTPQMPYPARRDQVIEAQGPERCTYYSTDAFFGPNAVHVMFFCAAWIKRGFDDTARALKARAEALHAERRQAA
jgi:uncharacterized protein YndB with AHSA1/START domain